MKVKEIMVVAPETCTSDTTHGEHRLAFFHMITESERLPRRRSCARARADIGMCLVRLPQVPAPLGTRLVPNTDTFDRSRGQPALPGFRCACSSTRVVMPRTTEATQGRASDFPSGMCGRNG